MDLVYADRDAIRIFFNDNGNRFRAPLAVPLPAAFTDRSQIGFADI